MIYKFSAGYRLKTDAQVVGEHLDNLEKQHGHLDSTLVLEDARNVDSPIHEEFEWNDTVAADKYRDTQAQYIIRSVVAVMVNQSGDERILRAFVNLGPGTGHTQIERVIASSDLTSQLLDRALADLRRWRFKYQVYKELSGLVASVAEVSKPFEQVISQDIQASA